MRILLAVVIAMALAISLSFAGGQGQGGNAAVPDQQGNGSSQQPTLYRQMDETGNGTGQGRAEAQNGQEAGNGSAVQQEQQTRNEGDEQGLLIMEQARSQAMSLNRSIKEAEARYADEASEMPAQQVQVYQNQNRVRVAVHALLAAENLTGIGKNVSAVAREFNNSIQATVRSEEKVRERSGIGRFLFGGDEKAAGELEQQAIQNQQRIMQMQQLVLQCSDCEPGVQAMLQEQLGNMAQEQTRLMQLAQDEKKDKGIFGWLWK